MLLPLPPFATTARSYGRHRCRLLLHHLHHRHQNPNTFQWNGDTSDNAGHHPEASLSFYRQMQSTGVPPNDHTFLPLLKAASALGHPTLVPQIQTQVLRRGLMQDPFVAAALMRSGRASDACKLFDELPHHARDAVAWTALISALAPADPDHALREFSRMRWYHVVDAVILGVILPAAADAGDHAAVSAIQGLAVKCGLDGDAHLASTLLHMYGRCGLVDDAQRVFLQIPSWSRNVVSWNSLIATFAANGESLRAIATFHDMLCIGFAPNQVTILVVFKAVAEMGCFDACRRIHGRVAPYYSEKGVEVSTAMFTMYARCGDLSTARQIFDGIDDKNVVCWSAMLAGYEQNSDFEEALRLFRRMLFEEAKPNEVTLVSAVSACSGLGSLRLGKTVHKYALMTGINMECAVSSSLINMYAKNGDLALARKVFEKMCRRRSFVMWSAMIGAEGLHGKGSEALRLCSDMIRDGHKPNDVTFVSLLSACSHAGLVEDGLLCFKSMEQQGVSPTAKHYACMVDLLGRAGRLDEALNLILGMEVEPDVAVWGSLLGACRLHGNCSLGEVAEKELLRLDPSCVGHHVLLANMFNEAGRMEDVIRTRVAMRNKGLKKTAGLSFVEIGNHVYSFGAEDRIYCGQHVYDELHALDERVKQAGHAMGALFDVGMLSRGRYHSERLAIAFALNRAVGIGEPIRISKNLRYCRDCHAYTTLVSKVCNRELVVRDAHRFHHFIGGSCSCGDYW